MVVKYKWKASVRCKRASNLSTEHDWESVYGGNNFLSLEVINKYPKDLYMWISEAENLVVDKSVLTWERSQTSPCCHWAAVFWLCPLLSIAFRGGVGSAWLTWRLWVQNRKQDRLPPRMRETTFRITAGTGWPRRRKPQTHSSRERSRAALTHPAPNRAFYRS